MRYVPPRARPGRPESTADRVRRLVLTEEARSRQVDKPFDPEAPREHYAQKHHFAVNRRHRRNDSERGEIVAAMARTFFVCAWADAMEEAGRSRELSGQELMDIAPATSDEAGALAGKVAREIEAANGMSLPDLYEKMLEMPGRHSRTSTPFDFGYCLAMMYMGSGVSWFDDHPGDKDDLKVPYGEGMYLDSSELSD